MSKLLIGVDVDGPLNPYRAKPTRRPVGYETHRLAPDGRTFRVWLNPDHGRQLVEFAERIDGELVWLTTWEHHANVMIGPAIGLPELPVIEFGFNGHRWKYEAAADYAEGRPLLWFDDDFDLFPTDKEWFEARRSEGTAPTRLHWVDPRIGLTELDFTQAARWAEQEVRAMR